MWIRPGEKTPYWSEVSWLFNGVLLTRILPWTSRGKNTTQASITFHNNFSSNYVIQVSTAPMQEIQNPSLAQPCTPVHFSTSPAATTQYINPASTNIPEQVPTSFPSGIIEKITEANHPISITKSQTAHQVLKKCKLTFVGTCEKKNLSLKRHVDYVSRSIPSPNTKGKLQDVTNHIPPTKATTKKFSNAYKHCQRYLTITDDSQSMSIINTTWTWRSLIHTLPVDHSFTLPEGETHPHYQRRITHPIC